MSLVAVFLALAVGILVGSSLLSGSSVERQVSQRLEQQFRQLFDENKQQRQDINGLLARLKKNEEFERGVMPSLITGQLAWRRVGIIQTGDYPEATQHAKAALEMAGAKVVSVTTVSNLTTQSAIERANSAVRMCTGDVSATDSAGKVLKLIAQSVVTGSDPGVMGVLEQKELVSAAGEYDKRLLMVVVVGGCRADGDPRPLQQDVTLIDALKALGATAVGCEPANAVTSCVSVYGKESIPTVDNVDTPMGQVSLVFALLGDEGNFGIKDSANRIIPGYFESGQWRYQYRH